jgi:PAS domain S-box-containing protein
MVPTAAFSDYLALFRHLPGNFLLLRPDADATIVDNSERHAAVSLKSRAEVVGKPLFEAYPAADQNEADIIRASHEHVRRYRQAHTMPLIRYDLQRPDGRFEERYWQATHYPILDEQGELRFILQETEDVTEQHRAEQLHRRTEQELTESQRHTRFLLEMLPLMLWTTRPDGTADYQNPGWLAFTGRTLAEAAEWGWLEDIHPDDRAHVQQAWEQALARGDAYQVEYRLRRHDGQYRWLLVRAVPRRAADGRIICWVGTGTDVHEQRQAQQQLADKDRELQQILQRLPAHIATLRGPEHVYSFLNDRSQELFGGRAELGLPAAQVLPDLTRGGMIELLDRVYRTGETVSLTEVPMPQPPGPDGSVATRYFDGTFQALLDEQGQPTGVLVFGVEVTQRVRAKQRAAELQEAVRQHDQQFRLLVESLPLYVYITDAEGHMLYVNPQRQAYTGQDLSRALSHWLEPVHPDDQPRMRALFAEGRKHRRPWTGEYRLRGRDGQYRWVLTHAVPLCDDAGQVLRWYGSSVDIDDHKQLLQRLEIKDRELQLILSQLPAYVATVIGPEYRYAFVTPSYQELMGGRIELGRRAADLLPEVVAQGHLALLDEVYRTQQPYTAHEALLLLPDPATGGTREYFLNFVYQPLLDAQNQVQGILAFGVDVTEQVQQRRRAAGLEAEVRRSDERLRRMTEALPTITYINEATGQGHYASPQWYAYTGLPPGSDIAQHWRAVTHPDDLPRVEQEYATARAENRGWRFEMRFRGHDGQYRWFLNQAQPELDAAGQVLRWYGSNTDIDDQKRFQQELEQKDEQLQRMLRNLPAIVNTMEGPEHRYTYVSAQMRALVGERVQPGRRVADALPEISAQGFVARLDEVYRSGEPFTALEQHVDIRNPETGQLEAHYFSFTYQLLPALAHRPETRGILSFAIDVTEQVRARQQAQALQVEVVRQTEQLRRMTEALPAISFILSADMQLEYFSPQWYQVTGFAPGTDAGAVWPTLIHPDDQAPARAVYDRARAGNEPLEFEYRLLYPDGQYRWQVCRAVPELDARGQAVRWYGTLVDNHTQKELQQELRRSEAQFRFMAESIPQVVWTAQPDGQLDYLNQRWTELTGVPVEEALRFGWAALVPDEAVDTVVGKYRTAIELGQDYEQESPLRSAQEGQYRWFLHRATPMRDAEGRVVKWFGTSTDIHDYKQAQQQLQAQNAQLTRINQDLDNFVYTASHDLKQPVNNMAGIFQELMSTATFADPAAATLVRMFEQALQQMHGTIQDLSDVVQVQRQHEQLPAERVELLPFTHEVLRSVQAQISSLGAEFELDFAAFPALQFVRPNLQSILYNLLSNALKYAHPDRPPRVRVATERAPDGSPVLLVQDNGLGIDLERHGAELFQMFRRFHDHVEGSGMGLYLVNRIVQQLGGHLAVESEVQAGTVFRLYLPGAVPAPAGPRVAAEAVGR